MSRRVLFTFSLFASALVVGGTARAAKSGKLVVTSTTLTSNDAIPRGLPMKVEYQIGVKPPAIAPKSPFKTAKLSVKEETYRFRMAPVPISSRPGRSPIPTIFDTVHGTMHVFGAKYILTQKGDPDVETVYARSGSKETPIFTIAGSRGFGGASTVMNHKTGKRYLQIRDSRGDLTYYTLSAGGLRGSQIPQRQVKEIVFARTTLPGGSRFSQ